MISTLRTHGLVLSDGTIDGLIWREFCERLGKDEIIKKGVMLWLRDVMVSPVGGRARVGRAGPASGGVLRRGQGETLGRRDPFRGGDGVDEAQGASDIALYDILDGVKDAVGEGAVA